MILSVSYDFIRTGRNYNEVLTSIKRSIRQLARNYPAFYIGKTNDPEKRAGRHDSRWTDMVVLYETSSADRVARMERDLIEHFREDCACVNESWGGEGPTAEYGPYFIYILR